MSEETKTNDVVAECRFCGTVYDPAVHPEFCPVCERELED